MYFSLYVIMIQKTLKVNHLCKEISKGSHLEFFFALRPKKNIPVIFLFFLNEKEKFYTRYLLPI